MNHMYICIYIVYTIYYVFDVLSTFDLWAKYVHANANALVQFIFIASNAKVIKYANENVWQQCNTKSICIINVNHANWVQIITMISQKGQGLARSVVITHSFR